MSERIKKLLWPMVDLIANANDDEYLEWPSCTNIYEEPPNAVRFSIDGVPYRLRITRVRSGAVRP